MLLGWIAGQMVITDPAVKGWADTQGDWLQYAAPAAGALFVLLVGKWLAARAQRARAPAATAAAAELAPPGGRLRSILLAVDGSPSSERATRYLIAMLEGGRRDVEAPKLNLVNVQRPVSGDVSRFVASDSLKDYHRENAEKALVPARALLDAAGLKYEELQRVGDPPIQIAEAAQAQGSDLIVMGTRGLGTHTAGLIGSVAQGTVAAAAVPVLLVK